MLEMGSAENWSWCCCGRGVVCGTVNAEFCFLLHRQCFMHLNVDFILSGIHGFFTKAISEWVGSGKELE